MKINVVSKILLLLPILYVSCLLSGCVPVLVGGGAAVVGSSLIKEKGLTGSISDSEISTKIQIKLYQKEVSGLGGVSYEVQNGEVLLTGTVVDEKKHTDALKAVWSVKGVKRVIDNIVVEKEASSKDLAQDTWITTKLKSKMVFNENISSVNYTIHTSHGVVYLMGVAQNQKELEKVTELARHIDGVRKVVSYVHLKGDPDL